MEAGIERGQSPSLWQRMLVGRNPKRTLVRLGVLIGGSLVIFIFVLLPIRIEGSSMHPTYRDGGVNFVNRLAYLRSRPRRGDVVGIKTTGVRVMYLKRVIGLPGETVTIREGMVRINGEPLDEPYVKERAAWEVPLQQLGPDEYLVIGDNRGMDQRLHTFGIVREDKIAGRVLW